MIEMIYKGNRDNNREEDKRKLPKNVRQIGEVGNGKKIYLEDYAVTYLHQVEAAVLLGEVWERPDGRYLFLHGAIQVEDPTFGEENWEGIYRKAKEYFGESEILGWSMRVPEQVLMPTAEMNEIYKAHFKKEDTVLLLYEPTEKEDIVFVEEQGSLKRVSGYYVYYDRNKSMQDYMMAVNPGKSVEKEAVISDKAIRSFRKKSEEKKEKAPEKQARTLRFLYGASTFLVLTILVIGVTMINNYDKMKSMELTLSDMTKETVPAMAYRETEETILTIETEKMSESLSEETESETEMVTETMTETEMIQETQATVAVPSHTEQAAYTVKEGDTLADICQMYYGTTDRMDEICELNGIADPNHILLGQKIKLP